MWIEGTFNFTYTVHVYTFSTFVHLQYWVIFVQKGLFPFHGLVVKQPYTTYI